MYAIRVKPKFQKKVCNKNEVWVGPEGEDDYYVSFANKGEWETRREAKKHIKETFEEIVEV